MHMVPRCVMVGAVAVMALVSPAHAGWKKTGLGKGGDYCSVAVDPNGHPHVSFLDPSNPNNYVLRHAFYDGKAWRKDRVDSGNVGWYNSIALDSQGRPHIAYLGGPQQPTLKYASFDGTTWTTSTLDDGGFSASLVMDADDHPHISYAGDASGSEIRYAHHDGANWNIETIQGNVLYFGGTSIALGGAGAVHITFADSSSPRRLYWATNASGSWDVSYVADGRQGSLALDSAGRPQIFYVDETASKTRYAVWNGLSWDVIELPAGDATSLALDGLDQPHIALGLNASGYSVLAYARNDGSGFFGDVLGNINTGLQNSLALDSLGLPHVVSQRVDYFTGATQLFYLRLTLPDLGGTFQNIARTPLVTGETLTASLVVSNAGNAGSKAGSVQYYLSDDDVLDAGDAAIGPRRSLGAIGPGKSRTITFTYTAPASVAGKHLLAALDSQKKVREINEKNNTADGVIP